ncbi:MAG: 4Fe-4S binding protein [Clostridia bacterium]|nr:4Fe-4S binding protein [Clostridia bacterium]
MIFLMKKMRERTRLIIQLAFAALTNGYVSGFLGQKLYKGKLKQFCLPGLNCYSCPGALGSCPIGALQAVAGDRSFSFSFYVMGCLVMLGALIGRLVCGFLCPFGLVQDLMYKIPVPKVLRKIPGDRYLRFLKYIILVLMVLVLPDRVTNIIGQGDPWFCKWICPSGTLLGGVPQVLSTPALQASLGFLFSWKMGILILVLALSSVNYRPFCKYLCPLGAIYGLCNPVSLYHLEVDKEKCTRCGACSRACGMGVDVPKAPNSPECIRCGKCASVCPHDALQFRFVHRKKEKHGQAENIEN